MQRSTRFVLAAVILLALGSDATAGSVRVYDAVNPPTHVYSVSDTVTVNVLVYSSDLGDIGAIDRIVFHVTHDANLTLTSFTDLLGSDFSWQPLGFVGGVCDLLDPYGSDCVAHYDPTGLGFPFSGERVATATFEVNSVASGQATIAPFFAPTDGLVGRLGGVPYVFVPAAVVPLPLTIQIAATSVPALAPVASLLLAGLLAGTGARRAGLA